MDGRAPRLPSTPARAALSPAAPRCAQVTPELCESVRHARDQQTGVLVGLGQPEEAGAWSAAFHEMARAIELLEPYGARTIGVTPAFRKFAARNHPDKGGDAEDFKLVQGMLRILELPTFNWYLFGIHGAVALFSFAVRAGLLEKWRGEAGVEAAASSAPATHALVALPDNSVECWELHDLEIVSALLLTSLTCGGCLPSARSPPSFPKSLDFQPQSFEAQSPPARHPPRATRARPVRHHPRGTPARHPPSPPRACPTQDPVPDDTMGKEARPSHSAAPHP